MAHAKKAKKEQKNLKKAKKMERVKPLSIYGSCCTGTHPSSGTVTV